MAEPKTIYLAGGGTGGHLYPGIAVAEALRRRLPEARLVFLCTTREIDRTILQPTGFEFIPQPIVPPVRTVSGLLKFWKSWRETKDLVRRQIRERRPSAIIGLGGYAAGVAVKMCGVRKIPAAILNPDVVPGKANQYLMRYVRLICCQFEQTRPHVPYVHQSKIRITGCPIRTDLCTPPLREQAAGRLGLNPAISTLLVTGASQGAATVNQGVLEALRTMKLQGWQVLHLAGKEHAESVRAAYRELDIAARVIDFTPAMADVWAVSDLAVARSGASTCAELTACGVPAILLPYPFHRDMHQRANARVLADTGAAVLLEDFKDARRNAEQLKPNLEALLYDSAKRTAMAAAARSLGRRDAADAVAEAVMELTGKLN